MRILNLVAGEKWTGTAAVVFDQTAALVDAGLEAQFGFVGESPLAKRLRGLGWARPLFQCPPRWPLSYARDVRNVRDTVLREGFDVVHAHGSHDHWIAAVAVAGSGVRLARTVHHLRHAPRDLLSRRLFARTRALAFGNTEIAKCFQASGPVHSPVVDTERFRPGPKPLETLRHFDLPADRFLVGTIGKLAAGRGHREALEILSRLPESIAAVHIGHGELLEQLKRRAVELRIDRRNFWLGYQEEALADLYRCFDAFLFTASGSEQGQRAILEAMASGLPTVALDEPGVRDLLTDGREGLVAQREEDLSDRLLQLFESSELRVDMSHAARRRALDFTGVAFARQARGFYEDVLQAPR